MGSLTKGHGSKGCKTRVIAELPEEELGERDLNTGNDEHGVVSLAAVCAHNTGALHGTVMLQSPLGWAVLDAGLVGMGGRCCLQCRPSCDSDSDSDNRASNSTLNSGREVVGLWLCGPGAQGTVWCGLSLYLPVLSKSSTGGY